MDKGARLPPVLDCAATPSATWVISPSLVVMIHHLWVSKDDMEHQGHTIFCQRNAKCAYFVWHYLCNVDATRVPFQYQYCFPGIWIPIITHWGRVTHICVGKTTIIGSDNGLSPGWRQAIIWTNAGILLIGPMGTNFSEIWIGIQTFSLKKIHLKMSSAKWRPFCLGLNVIKMRRSRGYL